MKGNENNMQKAKTPAWVEEARLTLDDAGIDMAPGFDEEALSRLEQQLHIQFPAAYKTMLSAFVPYGEDFPDWQAFSDPQQVRKFKDKVFNDLEDGFHGAVLFGGWMQEWGACPEKDCDRWCIAQKWLKENLIMLPVYIHRHINLLPHKGGHSVYSVWGGDIIFFGKDLPSYIQQEWGDLDENEKWKNRFLGGEALFADSFSPRPLPFFDAYNLDVFQNEKNGFYIAWNALVKEWVVTQNQQGRLTCSAQLPRNLFWTQKPTLEILLPDDIKQEEAIFPYLNQRDRRVSLSLMLECLHFEKQALIAQMKEGGIPAQYLENDWNECTLTCEYAENGMLTCAVTQLNQNKLFHQVNFETFPHFHYQTKWNGYLAY